MSLIRSQAPFLFKTQLSLVELTGLKAKDLSELHLHLEAVPDSSIYYHTHHFLQQHQFLTPEPPNDFAYWVTHVLQEDEMGEKLAAMDTVRFNTLEALRKAIRSAIDEFLEKKRELREAPSGEEFHFMKCILFTIPTEYVAYDLKEFSECLKQVSIHCLYNHIFTARLRPPLGVNDFSHWLRASLEEKDLAKKIEKLDPYTYTMEGLRKKIAHLVERRLQEVSDAEA
jgi:hypothetical protein